QGTKKGLSGYIWILKILIPISFFTMLIDYNGWLNKIDFILEPVMGLLSLPSVAALPLIVGLLTGIYGAVAAMTVLPMTVEQMTLVAIFLLISHNMIQEGIIQSKSGCNFMKATIFRLIASVITVAVSAQILIPETAGHVIGHDVVSGSLALMPVLKSWGIETFYLCIKIFAIIMVLMVIIEIMKGFDFIPKIIKLINPLLKFMGLDRQVGMLWLAATLFGISYGAAVIVEEAKENEYLEEELAKLHLSIGINHAMIEDPALFLPLGLSAFWLWIPRLVTAVLAVQMMTLWLKLRPAQIRT
ncbi:iron transporter, partial [Desulfobacterales bacterium HSG17]|nr:iron transporter [Desulfobacterales bacterium HSG17]